MVRFSVLGPLMVEADDGSPVVLRRPSQRSTLAVLLLRATVPVDKGQLIDAIWGERQPDSAGTALRVRIRDARQALGDHARIQTCPAGYHIVVRPGELDADAFRVLLTRGRTALEDGNAREAATHLGRACRLWRDPPLADVPDTPQLRPAASALLELRRDAREWLIDARLALGHHHELIGQIRTLMAADPMLEHPHVQLMLALYRCGQKAAALDTYGRLRELTARELGQEPGPEAQQMLQRMLVQDPDLLFRSRPWAATATPPGRCQHRRTRCRHQRHSSSSSHAQ